MGVLRKMLGAQQYQRLYRKHDQPGASYLLLLLWGNGQVIEVGAVIPKWVGYISDIYYM